MNHLFEFLSTHPLFGLFTSAELGEVLKLTSEIAFAKDDVVVRLGEPAGAMYLVCPGPGLLEVWDGSTPPIQVGALRAGDYFGEGCLLEGRAYRATVTVARRTSLLAFDLETVRALVFRKPEAIDYFRRNPSGV